MGTKKCLIGLLLLSACGKETITTTTETVREHYPVFPVQQGEESPTPSPTPLLQTNHNTKTCDQIVTALWQAGRIKHRKQETVSEICEEIHQ